MTFPPHLIQHSHLSQAARLAAAMHTHRTFLVQHTKTTPLIRGTTKTPGFHELHLKQGLSYTEITERNHAKPPPDKPSWKHWVAPPSELRVLFKLSVISVNGTVAFTHDIDVHMAYFLH